MTKKNTSIWIEPRAQEKLKDLSKKWGKPVGDIIEGLIRFGERAEKPEKLMYIKDPNVCERITGLYETDMANAGGKAVWVDAKSDEELKLWLLDGQDEASLSEAAKKELEIALKMLRGKGSK
jgi:hypothetical protein